VDSEYNDTVNISSPVVYRNIARLYMLPANEDMVNIVLRYHTGIRCRTLDLWVPTTYTIKQLKKHLCEKVSVDDPDKAQMTDDDGQSLEIEGAGLLSKIKDAGGFLVVHLFPHQGEVIVL
tara:strand:+ start:126 stop:485 length:360 start_codon:yes stop_codon:yes gene_type:complete